MTNNNQSLVILAPLLDRRGAGGFAEAGWLTNKNQILSNLPPRPPKRRPPSYPGGERDSTNGDALNIEHIALPNGRAFAPCVGTIARAARGLSKCAGAGAY